LGLLGTMETSRGLLSDNCLKTIKLLNGLSAIDDNAPSHEKAVTIERVSSKLYAVLSRKIMQISADMGELLLTLSRESMERFHELEQYVKLV